MKRLFVVAALVAALLLSTGCMSRAIKEGVGAVTGAEGVALPIKPISENLAGKYFNIQLEPFADQTAFGVPQVIKDTLAAHVAERAAALYAERKIPFQPGARTLTIRGTYIYYETANNTTDQVFGPFEELLARVQLYDGRTLLGEAYCVGRSTQSVNKGPEKKAQGLAKAIVTKWIGKAYPKP